MGSSRVAELREYGQNVWIDEIRREFFGSGELDRMIDEDGVTGMTTNPSIFEKAIAGSDLYDSSIRALGADGRSAEAIFDELSWTDVREVADRLKSVYQETDGLDGYVSIEVPAHLAYDAERSIEEGVRIWNAVGRPNIFIKIPGTAEGIGAVRALIGRGINVNVTLLFSQEQYGAAARAYARGLLDLHAGGGQPKSVYSVASVFVSRIDTAVDAEIDRILKSGGPEDGERPLGRLRGRAAVANCNVVYAALNDWWSGPEFEEILELGGRKQPIVWGSTSTKNPDYRDVKYVEDIIGPDTINTVPKATIDLFRDHGEARATLGTDYEGAKSVLEELEAGGVRLGEILENLQRDGVAAFDQSYKHLLEVIEQKKTALIAG
ncbi:MAG: transaldolase [Terriglobia bacterium]